MISMMGWLLCMVCWLIGFLDIVGWLGIMMFVLLVSELVFSMRMFGGVCVGSCMVNSVLFLGVLSMTMLLLCSLIRFWMMFSLRLVFKVGWGVWVEFCWKCSKIMLCLVIGMLGLLLVTSIVTSVFLFWCSSTCIFLFFGVYVNVLLSRLSSIWCNCF